MTNNKTIAKNKTQKGNFFAAIK